MEVSLSPSNETILEQLESQGYSVSFQCRSGYCGACRVQKKSGSIEYSEEPLAAINEGEFLPCCSRATSNILIAIGS